jgi:hypothetical protein
MSDHVISLDTDPNTCILDARGLDVGVLNACAHGAHAPMHAPRCTRPDTYALMHTPSNTSNVCTHTTYLHTYILKRYAFTADQINARPSNTLKYVISITIS